MTTKAVPVVYGHRWYLRSILPERRWQSCRIVSAEYLGGGARGTITVEFRDGTRVQAPPYAIKATRLRVLAQRGFALDHSPTLRRGVWVCPGCARGNDKRVPVSRVMRAVCRRRRCDRCGTMAAAKTAHYVKAGT